jgi:hypothetical protein
MASGIRLKSPSRSTSLTPDFGHYQAAARAFVLMESADSAGRLVEKALIYREYRRQWGVSHRGADQALQYIAFVASESYALYVKGIVPADNVDRSVYATLRDVVGSELKSHRWQI